MSCGGAGLSQDKKHDIKKHNLPFPHSPRLLQKLVSVSLHQFPCFYLLGGYVCRNFLVDSNEFLFVHYCTWMDVFIFSTLNEGLCMFL